MEQLFDIFKEKAGETEEERSERLKLSGAEKMVREFENHIHLSFSRGFATFSIAYLLFKGTGPSQTKEITRTTLISFMKQFAAATPRTDLDTYLDTEDRPIHPEVIGFFLALLPYIAEERDLKTLMKAADAGEKWCGSEDETRADPRDRSFVTPPRIPLAVFGEVSAQTALLMGSFISMMLKDRRPDGITSTMLFSLMADLSGPYPDIVQLCCESLIERMLQLVSTTSNVELLAALDIIFRQSLYEEYASGHRVEHRHSSSSLGSGSNLSETGTHRSHLRSLGMEGLALPATFTQLGQVKEKHHQFVKYIGAFFG